MKKQLLSICMVFTTTMLMAQWNGDPTINNAICTFSNTTTKNNLVTVSDGNGGMWLAWEDARNSTTTGTDIYCQKINANGSLAFDANGILVTNADAGQTSISMVSDSAGGVIIAWTDARTNATTSNDVYMQRIKSDGTITYVANGVAVSNGTLNELGPVLSMLNTTECLVTWRDSRLGNADIYANKITIATGNKVFTEDVVIVNATGTQQNFQVLADGNGGAFVIWEDQRVSSSRSSIYAQYLNNSGVPQWQANGIAVCDANATGINNNRQAPKFITDGTGGFVATWADLRAGSTDNNIYAQRIAPDGSALWTTNGIAICTATGNQTIPLITRTGSNIFITWYDLRDGTSNVNVYAQSVALNATMQWDVNGLAICTNTGNQPSTSSPTASSRNLNIVSDSADGVIIIWDDTRNSGTTGTDIYAQRIKADKTIMWATNGVLVTNATGNQTSPVSLTNGSRGVLIAWPDSRTTTNGEIYASNLLLTGVLPLTYNSIAATTKNSTVVVNWQTSNEVNTNNFVVQRSADGTQFYKVGTVKANGIGGKYAFTDFAPLQGSNYYRIQSLDKDGFTQLSSTVKANTESLVIAASVRVYPNPTVTNTLQVQFNNIELGNYFAKIIDINGRLLQQEKMFIQSGSTSKNVQLNNAIQAGNYVLQIVDTQGKIIGSKTFTKQ